MDALSRWFRERETSRGSNSLFEEATIVARESKRASRHLVVGEHLLHRHLWEGARFLDSLAAEDMPVRYFPRLAASLFLYFSFEAFLNYLGNIVAPQVWADERTFFSRGPSKYRGTLGKLDYLMDQLHVAGNKSTRPYRTIKTLDGGRDALTHPRAEMIKRKQRPAAPIPEAQIYRLANKKFFTAACEDIEAMASELLKRGHPPGIGGSKHPFRGTLTWAVSWTGQ
jgi:hypothetical protein